MIPGIWKRGCSMKMKNKFIKLFLVLSLGCVAVNLSLMPLSNCVTQPSMEKNTWACGEIYQTPDGESSRISAFGITKSDLLGYVFQIIFILFFISPPIIALMLFLIWKELKERNKMK
jgi:hypothetical protein